jgi:hypothetical protein
MLQRRAVVRALRPGGTERSKSPVACVLRGWLAFPVSWASLVRVSFAYTKKLDTLNMLNVYVKASLKLGLEPFPAKMPARLWKG